MSSPVRRASSLCTGSWLPGGDVFAQEVPKQSHHDVKDGARVISRTLRNENDLLRYQLNDIIAREKNQRIELQRLRDHRDVEVASLVQAATQHLKGEVEQMKFLLQSTSAQLLQALAEKEKAVNDSHDTMRTVEELKHNAEVNETCIMEQLRGLKELLSKTSGTVTALADSVEGFQRHVLPTFKPSGTNVTKLTRNLPSKPGVTELMTSELERLEAGITLLRVIVDAKNDTLVLIRGKLKQENEDLKTELQLARDRETRTSISDRKPNNATAVANDDMVHEKTVLRQELQSLQNLYCAEVKQLKAKLKYQEEEGVAESNRFCEIQHECKVLQSRIESLEAAKDMLEVNLKDETSARSQLVSQVFNLRKENEKLKTELETLKLNQKFLVRQPRSGGRIPVEKMDLMNTVNQLLLEMNKLKSDKVTLEEEIKTVRRCQMRDQMTRTVTARDVAMAASNKVGDGEIAGKLASTRLNQLALGITYGPCSASQLALTDGDPNQNATLMNVQSDSNAMEASEETREVILERCKVQINKVSW
ncbi:uncharacterized protein [Physcomitrium patens]|uniref:uncharacterized protein isoform X2 n=1 Tax=Physcomitrium patens TaxID=3218 RepID=UPI000D15FFB2|nr:centromere protein F-like isoform X2 [Physcomitrium patens]|eukprot:XP_024388399.1 centromere protein F-like isoform X2 [Physcomitrella patens]